MYPYELFWGLDLYSILIVVGVITCMVMLRVLSDRRGLRAPFQNLLLMDTVLSVVLGYGSAVLVQGLYNIKRLGKFEITNTTGSTFYGGLIGGAAVFILIYFIAGHFLFRDRYHVRHFRTVSDLAPTCITIAHAFGRIGCLMAGCCYGAKTDAWYGITMVNLGYKVIPVQLFESIVLFILAGVTFWMFWTKKKYEMSVYMIGYGIWRFFVEYLRDDERGDTFVDFLSPSQLISIVLILGGVILLVAEILWDRKHPAKPEEPAPKEPAPEEHPEAAS